MKKDTYWQVRVAPDENAAFRTTCDSIGVKASAVIRDLCRASIPYMSAHCRDGRWRAPVLITERQAAVMEMQTEAMAIQRRSEGNSGELIPAKSKNGSRKARE
jgi:hypothetical protein